MKSQVKLKATPGVALKELEKLSKSLKGPDAVKVGVPKNANDYPKGESIVMVAAVHEFGSDARKIPARSFLRTTLVAGRTGYKALFKKLSKKIVKGEMTKKEALNYIGLTVQGDVQGRISAGIEPKLMSREGTPLIYTGHLRQAITYQVEDE